MHRIGRQAVRVVQTGRRLSNPEGADIALPDAPRSCAVWLSRDSRRQDPLARRIRCAPVKRLTGTRPALRKAFDHGT